MDSCVSYVRSLILNLSFPVPSKQKISISISVTLNYESLKFPFREINICLFLKDSTWSAYSPFNVQDNTSVPNSLFGFSDTALSLGPYFRFLAL